MKSRKWILLYLAAIAIQIAAIYMAFVMQHPIWAVFILIAPIMVTVVAMANGEQIFMMNAVMVAISVACLIYVMFTLTSTGLMMWAGRFIYAYASMIITGVLLEETSKQN